MQYIPFYHIADQPQRSIAAVRLGLFPGVFFCGLPKANSGATAVLVDEACLPRANGGSLGWPRARSFSHPPDVSCSERTLW